MNLSNQKTRFLFAVSSISVLMCAAILGTVVIPFSGNAQIPPPLLRVSYGGMSFFVRAQETFFHPFDIGLSETAIFDDSVESFDYKIVQKEKCKNFDNAGICVEYYPDLCPYLSTVAKDEGEDDIGVVAPHTTKPYPEAQGNLKKSTGDINDKWELAIKAPCFENDCPQDYNPQEFGPPLPSELKWRELGCDLWVETAGENAFEAHIVEVIATIMPIHEFTVVSPNGGEIWEIGKTYQIKWDGSDFPSNAPVEIKLQDSREDHNNPYGGQTIANTVNTGTYDFLVPNSLGPLSDGQLGGTEVYTVSVQVHLDNLTVADDSDAPFDIVIGEESALPDLSIDADSVHFYNDDGPFSPNIIKVDAEIFNNGEGDAEDAYAKLFIDDTLINVMQLGRINAGQKSFFTFTSKIEASHNLNNSNLRVETILTEQEDANYLDNSVVRPISFYFINFDHGEDAFRFKNWGYNNLDEYKEDFINFLSSQWHEGDIVTIIATSLIDPLANLIGLQGHCYGMSASSMAYYLWPDVRPVDKSTFLMEEQEVKPDIIERQWEQLLHIYPVLITAWDILLPYDATAEYEKVLHYIKDLQEPVGLALWEKGGNGGHEVVAYKVLDLGENEKRVYIYDNNYPLYLKRQDQYVLFKPMSNEANYNGGRYEYDRAFTTEPWKTIGTEELLSIIKTAFSKAIDKLWQQNVISLNVFSPVSPLITDNLGRSVGYKNGEFINEIPGASINEYLGAYFIYLPKNFIYTAELTGTDDGSVGIDVITPTSNTEANIQDFKNIPISRSLTITVSLDGSNRVVKDAQGNIVEPYLKQTINSDELEVLLRLSELRKIITNLNIIQGVKTSLITKIDSTAEALKKGNAKGAINQLNALANNITAQTGKHIMNEDADKLISAVEETKEMVLYFKM